MLTCHPTAADQPPAKKRKTADAPADEATNGVEVVDDDKDAEDDDAEAKPQDAGEKTADASAPAKEAVKATETAESKAVAADGDAKE